MRTAATTAAASSAKKVAEPKEVPEDVAEILKNAGIETCRRGCGAAYTGVTEAVIESTLFLVSENGVSLTALLEFLFCVRVVRIAVRMVLERELAIRALYFDFRSATAYAQDFVIVTFAVGCRNKKYLLSSFWFLVSSF